MYFKNYAYFLMIAQEGSISKAAEKLYLTQPSLSKYLKRLEENLGVELFSRESYPLTLTEAGTIYQRYLEDIRAKEAQLQQDFAEFREGLFGHVTLALTEWRSSVMLPALFPYFKEKYPHITLSIREGSHQQMLHWLEHGQADLALMHYPNDYQNLELDFLSQENVIMVVNQNDPLLQKMAHPPRPGEIQHLSTEEFLLFRDAPFILNIEGQNIRQIVLNFFSSLNITPNVVLEVKGDQTKQNLVQAGIGNSFAAFATFGVNTYREDLCYFSLGDPPLHWNLAVAYHKKHPPTLQAQKLILVIRELVLQGGTPPRE
ncbi:LysR family transcriptional regulator [uncultured Oscillibacter sp.]|uniref:LysR family transcriptional regulator n=1 Tax=uncultured Oscillibacter sp. TaxID=876091 RepID=UPI002806470C|nr:LysR family transcriptional regulator [uncultured Oscillibacter sp.]